MKYSYIVTIVSFLLFCAAVFFLPEGWRRRMVGIGDAVARPGEAMAVASMRVSREVLGGLPEAMTAEELDAMREELTRARQEIALHDQEMATLRRENRYLMKLLRHVKSTTEYTLVVSQVLRRRELSAYNETLLLNRGAADGLLTGQAVLSTEGFVGCIASTTMRNAVVRLHTSHGFTMAVNVPSRNVNAILENADGILFLNALTGKNFDTLRIGDKVVTSELGSDTMQANMLVGTIESMEWTVDGAPRYRVKAAAACEELSYLMVAIPAMRGEP